MSLGVLCCDVFPYPHKTVFKVSDLELELLKRVNRRTLDNMRVFDKMRVFNGILQCLVVYSLFCHFWCECMTVFLLFLVFSVFLVFQR